MIKKTAIRIKQCDNLLFKPYLYKMSPVLWGQYKYVIISSVFAFGVTKIHFYLSNMAGEIVDTNVWVRVQKGNYSDIEVLRELGYCVKTRLQN